MGNYVLSYAYNIGISDNFPYVVLSSVLIFSLTSGNPAVCAVESTKAVVVGQSVELEVYVSGIPPVISSSIRWFGPDGNELTESNATFHNNRRKLILDNVQNSSSGIYKCQVGIPDDSTAMDAIKLEVYSK